MPMYMLMADRPMATAPERSMAAFSTRHTRKPRSRAQLAASKAAPQPAMPPPTMSTSHSTVSICGSNGIAVLRGSGVDDGEGVDVQVLRLTHQMLGAEPFLGRGRLAQRRVDRTPGGGADRVLEPLDLAVAELDGPHDRVGAPQRRDPRPHRHHVGVAPHLDGALGANLHAGVALPAQVGFLVVALGDGDVERHQ